MEKIIIGNATLYHADCLEVLPLLAGADVAISDPPYEAQAHTAMRRTRASIEGRIDKAELGFDAITEATRSAVAAWSAKNIAKWALFFCQVEAVGVWKQELENAGAKYDRAWAWIKPDAAPRFNGQGPAQGFESIASAWCGTGGRSWNGGGMRNVLTYNVTSGRVSDHPTEKPLPLLMKLVHLYSNKGDTVIDFFMGSGTTGVACMDQDRKFIGIEVNRLHFDTACGRIEQAQQQMKLAL